MTTDQINALTAGQLGALTTQQVAGLTAAQVNSLGGDVNTFDTAQFRAMTAGQIAGLSTAQLTGLQAEDWAALRPTVARRWPSAVPVIEGAAARGAEGNADPRHRGVAREL
jgi:hypothetical protein